MKQAEFVTKVAKAIANNEIKSVRVRQLIMEIASTRECRPVRQLSRAYGDHTVQVIMTLEQLGIRQQGKCINGVNIRKGWRLRSDAPRGGRIGNIITVNFD